jgi:hypothetical protein
VEFADPAKQADWKRIGQAANTAQSKTGTRKTKIVDPLAELPDQAPTRKPLMLGLGVAACLALGVVGFFVFHKPPPSPPPSKDAYISIAKAPPGARVSIDGLPKGTADASGSLSLTVDPGTHELEVKMEGYDSFTDNPHLRAGQTVVDNIPPMTKLPPASNSGTLLMQGNLPVFKVFVDGRPLGLKKEGPLTLEAGSHTIQYANDDGSNPGPRHTVQIAAGTSFTDPFTLTPPPPPTPQKPQNAATPAVTPNNVVVAPTPLPPSQPTPPVVTTGSLSIQTTAGAEIIINNRSKGLADLSGIFNLDLEPNTYRLDIREENYDPGYKENIVITAGSRNSVSLPLKPKAAPVDLAVQARKEEEVRKVQADELRKADIKSIQTARDNFKTAYKSMNIAQIRGAWLDIDSDLKSINKTTKKLEDAFGDAKVISMDVQCPGDPDFIDPSTAKWVCTETQKLEGQDPKHPKVTYTFVKKAGGNWVLRNRISF